MRLTILMTFFSLFVILNAQGQGAVPSDKVIKELSKLKTTLDIFKQQHADLKEIDFPQLDEYGTQARPDTNYTFGKGFITADYPAMIFQSENPSKLISRIWLTKEFKGKLKDGKYLNLEKFTLDDILKLYSNFLNGMTGSEYREYWSFQNNGIALYVKKDSVARRHLPDFSFYASQPVLMAELPLRDIKEKRYRNNLPLVVEVTIPKKQPVIFVDSIRIKAQDISRINPADMASAVVYRDTLASKKYGPNVKDTVFFIETKLFAQNRYWKYFKSKSAEYLKVVPFANAGGNVQYILNKQILTTNFEGVLASVNDSNFKKIEIIYADQLQKDYGVADKMYGVVIIADLPESRQTE